jgi:hypothetical protein
VDGSDGVQCPAQRPVSGGPLGIGVLRCYRLDGHKSRLHFDATEGIEWKATRLASCGSVCLDAVMTGAATVEVRRKKR